jgi:hypothetical protein
MYTEEDLNSAVQAGIMTDATATAFRAHVVAGRHTPVVDEEYFRLITGFNDIFVVIACALLLVSVSWIGGSVLPWLGPLALAGAAWGLAEFFTRQRRMALPSIVLMLVFVGAALSLVKGLTDSLALGSAVAAMAAWLHWQRFKVPITVAAGAAALAALGVSGVFASPLQGNGLEIVVAFFAGVAVFMWALRWDAQDRQRQTRKADVAFWLHLLSAPLMVHPVFTALGLLEGRTGWLAALAVLALYAAITLTSLAIDRRALMVSALAYVLYAFSTLFKQYGVVSLGFAITALIIGSALLLLSAFWHVSRARVLRALPIQLQLRLAPVE